jgi:hypothetical protein
MIIEQTVEIPADYRIFLELPRSVPIGVIARVEIQIPAVSTNEESDSVLSPPDGIVQIRQLLQREMIEKETLAVKAMSGDGWEANARESYAES